MSEQAFRISVQENKIQQLKDKLALTVFPDELEDAEWDYGVPLADMKRLVARWRDGYDWRKHETELNNELPQFTRDVDVDGFGTLNIHYIHQRSQVEDAIPLLFVHGCAYQHLILNPHSSQRRNNAQGRAASLRLARFSRFWSLRRPTTQVFTLLH